jgi:hypothetical protein
MTTNEECHISLIKRSPTSAGWEITSNLFPRPGKDGFPCQYHTLQIYMN